MGIRNSRGNFHTYNVLPNVYEFHITLLFTYMELCIHILRNLKLTNVKLLIHKFGYTFENNLHVLRIFLYTVIDFFVYELFNLFF